MRVYMEPGTNSRGIKRVYDALKRYAPESLEFVLTPEKADLEIIHIFGRHDAVKQRISALKSIKRPYAMIQYCLRSTIYPNTRDWIDLWKDAKLIWSYYDLPALCREDGLLFNAIEEVFWGNFYYAPLGVDLEVFKETKYPKRKYIVGASSQHALTEGVRECAFAAKEVGQSMFFLGHELKRGNDIICESNLTDAEVADRWSQCKFISGLRRIEGFEQPVIEGALCGAMPILFDRPHYRKWFSEFAIFIKESPREQVIKDLTYIFDNYVPIVTEENKKLIRERFDWEKIIKGFWDIILL